MNRAEHILLIPAIAVLTLLWVVAPVRAAADPAAEDAVKAALVYNFARFTTWPQAAFDSEDEPLRICVLAGEELRGAFEAIDGRSVSERVVDVCFSSDVHKLAGSHLVYVPQSARERWPQLRAALGDAPVLTVGEMTGFLDAGGMMNLARTDNRLVFQVNLPAVKEAGLGVSSRILKLATLVVEEETTE